MAQSVFLNPTGVGTYTGNWAAFDYGTPHGSTLVDRVADRGDADTDNDGIVPPHPSDVTKFQTYVFAALTGADASDRVVRVVLHLRVGVTASSLTPDLYARVRRASTNVDPPTPASVPTGSSGSTVDWFERSLDLTSYRPGGGAWEVGDFDGSTFEAGLACDYGDGAAWQPYVVWLQLELVLQPVGVLLPAVRRAASSMAWRGRKIPVLGRARVGPALGALELGDVLYLSDRLAPTPEGRGWGLGLDEARAVQVRQLEDDLAAHTLGLDGLVLRGQAVLLHDSGRSIGGARTPNGITRLHLGGVTDTFERSSKAYVEQPDGLVGEVLVDEPALDRFGRLHEGAAQNDVLWSAFQDGETVWTLAGSAVYGTDEQLFEPEISGRYLSTPAGGSGAQSGITLYSLSWHALSFEYRTLTGATASVRIQRADDSTYWNAGTESWQAGSVDNALPAAATRARATLRIQKSTFGLNTSYTLTLLATGGTVRWWHAQSEKARKGKGWASSRMVSRAAAATRAHSYLETSNDSGERSWPGLNGAGRLRWRPAFSAGDAVGGAAFTLWRVAYAADEAELRYVPPASAGLHGALEHRRKVGGVWYTASLELDVAAGEVYRIAVRWQSRDQNGDAPGTLSVWCEGLVARAAGPTTLTESATAVWRRGGPANADGTQAEGWIWDETVEPLVPSDGELEEW